MRGTLSECRYLAGAAVRHWWWIGLVKAVLWIDDRLEAAKGVVSDPPETVGPMKEEA